MNEPRRTEPANVADRLLALEEQAAFQQQALDQMHQVLLRQQGEIDRLAGAHAALHTTLERLSAGGEDLPHEKPPHY
jgi:uncharacterized coiled-coil protein SlyX